MTISDTTSEIKRVSHYHIRGVTNPVGNDKLMLDLKHVKFRLPSARSTSRGHTNLVTANYPSDVLARMSNADLKSQSSMIAKEPQSVLSSKTLMIILT